MNYFSTPKKFREVVEELSKIDERIEKLEACIESAFRLLGIVFEFDKWGTGRAVKTGKK